MTRKASTTAPAVRIRENQRRARARRKELIDDLKSKTRDYEAQGVKATAQVQEAARKVLLENRRLRALLVEKGVPTAEIESYLHGHDYDASFTIIPQKPEPADMVNTQSLAARSGDVQYTTEMSTSDTNNHIRLESASQAGKNGKIVGSSSGTELLRVGEQAEEDLGCESPLPKIQESFSDCYCPEIEPTPDQAQSSGKECSVAANILANFRGHGDAEQARTELGCPDTAQCSITNAALLHVLDSAT